MFFIFTVVESILCLKRMKMWMYLFTFCVFCFLSLNFLIFFSILIFQILTFLYTELFLVVLFSCECLNTNTPVKSHCMCLSTWQNPDSDSDCELQPDRMFYVDILTCEA